MNHIKRKLTLIIKYMPKNLGQYFMLKLILPDMIFLTAFKYLITKNVHGPPSGVSRL